MIPKAPSLQKGETELRIISNGGPFNMRFAREPGLHVGADKPERDDAYPPADCAWNGLLDALVDS